MAAAVPAITAVLEAHLACKPAHPDRLSPTQHNHSRVRRFSLVDNLQQSSLASARGQKPLDNESWPDSRLGSRGSLRQQLLSEQKARDHRLLRQPSAAV